MHVDVVSFDYWNTLIHETFPGALVAARLPVMRDLLRDHGVDAAIDDLRSAHAVAQREFEATSAGGTLYQTEHAARRMVAELGLSDECTELLDRGFTLGSAQADVSVVADAPEVLAALAGRGFRLAVICDVGLTPSGVLVDWLGQRGLLSYFDALAFSDVIGAYKPAPTMFEWVMERTGCEDASRIVHIGDRLRTDVEGARRAGARSVRFTGVFDDPAAIPEADLVLAELDQLPGLLSTD